MAAASRDAPAANWNLGCLDWDGGWAGADQGPRWLPCGLRIPPDPEGEELHLAERRSASRASSELPRAPRGALAWLCSLQTGNPERV